ncbi:MAG: hypothetical protein VX638_04970, partial [Chloroflexota bacterium]|nr:hypothetical protein [Chloroflexota bacterium]
EPPYGLRDPSIDEERVLFVCRIDRIATFGKPCTTGQVQPVAQGLPVCFILGTPPGALTNHGELALDGRVGVFPPCESARFSLWNVRFNSPEAMASGLDTSNNDIRSVEIRSIRRQIMFVSSR